MPSISITKVQTMSQHSFSAPTRAFRFDDALALEVFVSASADLVALPEPLYQLIFQIIDPITESVVFSQKETRDFSDGADFWCLLGRNVLPPYTTPGSFGLFEEWISSGRGVFGFRALITAFQITTSTAVSPPARVVEPLEAFDVSGVEYFRVMGPVVREDDLTGTGILPGN